ncbi:MAG: aminopeptidase N [Pseudomonadota bacterium]
MRDNQAPGVIRREDYRAPDFFIDDVALYVDIRAGVTRITTDLVLRRNPVAAPDAPLRLHGEGMALRELLLDGLPLQPGDYLLDEKFLEVALVPASFRLRTVGEIDPAANTALEGLYVSHGMYCTQCEAEGFRRITWFLDRPDVMARFRTTIEADRVRYPLLLSNGNRTAHEELSNGRHRATWEDPFLKPCYLFALVAGDLACLADEFVTASGRVVTLQIFVEQQDLGKTAHAMDSLKRAMRWDEEVFGREYDLDIYMIVAVSHFNMGAMENKGLNIFNTSCVLANHRTQSDKAFQRVEAVIAHEYFHNWSGNRVTCRDWFQLSLKEGFTVYRDAEFSKDMHSRTVKRIEEVNFLRTVQFPEDAGPLAHPIRPDAYAEINNFYTVTIYEKGAEVVRMLRTLLGAAGFRRGCDLYFTRHDGQAVTCDDFVQAMEDANRVDLTQFRRWYAQAGTPVVEVTDDFDLARGEYRLHFRQTCPATPGQPEKSPFVIPVLLGLLDPVSGVELPVVCADPHVVPGEGGVLATIHADETELLFTGLTVRPLPSLLRGFSAPVKLQYAYTDEQLAFLARHDTDAFNRWNAGQELALRYLLADITTRERGEQPVPGGALCDLYAAVLTDSDSDPALAAEMLVLPAESYVADQLAVADPQAIHAARQHMRRLLAHTLRAPLLATYARFAAKGAWNAEPQGIARRALRNAVLELLMALADEDIARVVQRQFDAADNMTDQFAALRAAVHGGLAGADEMLARFHRQWHDEALVVDQWFSVQVTSPAIDALARARELLRHPQFELTNPNRVRSLVASFAGGNPAQFHRVDGAGYRFLAEQVIALDRINPQIAARIAGHFSRWRHYSENRQMQAAAALEEILAQPDLSPNLCEVAHKTRHDGAT